MLFGLVEWPVENHFKQKTIIFHLSLSVAIKIIDKDRFSFPSASMISLRNEATILKDLSHPGIVKMLNVFENEQRHWLPGNFVYVVMEKMDGGDLLDYVMARKTLSERQSK